MTPKVRTEYIEGFLHKEEEPVMTDHMNTETGDVEITEKRCYTVQELQKILGISRQSVYALLKRKEFRWFQIGGGIYRISKKSFDEWLDQMA